MDIKLDEAAVQALATTAILQTLDEDARTRVLEQAVASLLTPERDRYSGVGPTPLQKAFNAAINAAAYKVVREKITGDPQVAAQIDALLEPLVNAAMVEEAKNYQSTLAEAIGAAIGNWLAEVARERRDL